MIAFISTQKCKRPTLAARLLRKRDEYNLRESYILGMRVLLGDMNIYEGIGEKRLERQAVSFAYGLSHMNVSEILLDSQFPCKDAFDSFDILDSRCLYENMAGKIGVRVPGAACGTAAFFAHTIGRQEEKSLLKLASTYRYLIVVTDRDCAIICQNLRSRFGIAVIDNPTEGQLRMANYAAFLSVPRQNVNLQSSCIVFSPAFKSVDRVTGGKKIKALRLSLPKALDDVIPHGFEPLPIVSAAVRHGFFSAEEIGVMDYRLDNAI